MTKTANYYKRAAEKNNKGRLNLRLLNIGLFLTIATFAFFYLIGISDLTAKGFILQDLRSQTSDLEERMSFYEQEVNSLQSFYALNEQAKTLDMVAVSNIEYIKAGNSTVAKK
jgi:hypothetical protein